MAHYVITKDEDTLTVSGWSEQEAIEQFYDKTNREWSHFDDLTVDEIRPATVREAMVSEYGEDWQRTGPNHVFEVVNTYRTEYSDWLVINHTSANDVHGYDDPVSVSNYRVLQDRWSELEGLGRGPWSNLDCISLELDKPAPADLTEVLDGLADYPVIDEQEWSNVEQEMILEHWDSYGKSDVLDAVAEAIGADNRTDLTDNAEDIVSLLVWDGILDYGCGGGYPTMVDSSACDFGDKAVAEYVKQHFGQVVTVKDSNGYGDEVSFDLTPGNLLVAE